MLQGYKLKVEGFSELDIVDINSDSNIVINEVSNRVKESLDNFFIDGGDIDGDRLMEDWFPIINDCHVFISHSHADEEKAIRLSRYLYDNFGLVSFIDSMVWGYCDNLLGTINREFSLWPGESNLYDLEKTNNAASHVYMMLSSALNKMIDHCECLIFLSTEKSTISNISELNDKTYSPWIMSELLFSSKVKPRAMIERSPFVMLSESTEARSMEKDINVNKALKIQYSLESNHLHDLGIDLIKEWRLSAEKESEYRALTYLYNIVGDYKGLAENV